MPSARAHAPAPSAGQALRLGARATRRCAWLVAVALGVAVLRAGLTWPAWLFALAASRLGAERAFAQGLAPVEPTAVLAEVAASLTTPRTLTILIGLWLVGVLASGALRVAYLAGALPTLGEALAGTPAPPPRFATGLAFGFAPLLCTALLGAALQALAFLYALTSAAAGFFLALHPPGGARAVLAAGLGAVTLTSALAGVLLAALASDAALVRSALAGDSPARALAAGMARVARRPAAFLVAGLALAAAGAVVLGSARTLETLSLALAQGAPALVALGPQLMVTVLAAALAGLLDLWRLGTVATLSLGER